MTPSEEIAKPDHDLNGWDVLAVGRRQAWLFVTFCSPSPEHSERTLWIDTDFSVADPTGHSREGRTDEPPAVPLTLLEPLVMLVVEEVALGTDNLSLRFDDGSTLAISNTPNARDSDGWWLEQEK